MDDCVFCKIIKGELPCYKIYEDDMTLAFLDISKDSDGHTLVIPKKHYKSIIDCDSEYLEAVMRTVQKVGQHYLTCGYEGFNILNANDKSAQQSIFHLHIHIIPRKTGDNIDGYPVLNGAKKTLEEMHQILTMEK